MRVFIPAEFTDFHTILTQQKRNYSLKPANVLFGWKDNQQTFGLWCSCSGESLLYRGINRKEGVNHTDSPSGHWLSVPLWKTFIDRENGMAVQYQPKCKSLSIPTYHGQMFPDTTCWSKTFWPTPVAIAAASKD